MAGPGTGQRVLDSVGNLMDLMMLQWLTQGWKPGLDDNGNTIEVPLLAADINQIRQRLKDCGITIMASGELDVPATIQAALDEADDKAAKIAGRIGPGVPPMSDEPDAATA